jgi:outer membrane receptor protein involved in Fe transport
MQSAHAEGESMRIQGFIMLTLAGAAASVAQAQQPGQEEGSLLEEVIITAQKREESLQDVPISVNAIGGEKLAEANIVRLDDLKAYVPNLQVTETGIANNVYIRGIGSGLNQGFEQSVSQYSDGIYRGRGHQSRMPFLDLERVEVLRGPQPILFGKNAIAGAVNLVSARPGDEFEGLVRARFETETDERAADVVLSGPFTDTFGARLAVRYRETDGYQRNLTLNRDEPIRDEIGGRLTFRWAPSEAFDATLKIEGGSFDVEGRQVEVFGEQPAAPVLRNNGTPTGAIVNPLPGTAGLTYGQILRNAFQQDPGVLNNSVDFNRSSNGDFSNLDNEEAALTINYDFGGVTLTSVTGYSAYELDEGCDCDFTGATVFTAGIFEDFDQISQELRLTSPADQKVSWIAGLFYQDYDLEEADFVFFPANSTLVPLVVAQTTAQQVAMGVPLAQAQAIGQAAGAAFGNSANPRVFTQDSELYAVFAQATWNVTDAFRVTAGGRWTTEDKTGLRVMDISRGLGGPSATPGLVDALYLALLGIQRHGLAGERSEDNFSPLVNLQYDFGADSMAYLSWARGYKSGGYDARSNRAPPVGTFEYEPEKATSYELGLKTSIRGVAEFNAAVFFTDYEDLQTSAFDGRLGFNVGNGTAEVKGVELEGRWKPTERLLLSGSIAYLDFEWTRYDGQCYFAAPASLFNGVSCRYDGFDNQLSPDLTGVVSAEYSWPIGENLRLNTAVDVLYSDEYLVSLTLDPVAVQDSYTKLNARIALGGSEGRWELALVGRNLTDEEVISYAGDVPLAGSTFAARSYYGFVDPPRTLAIEGTLRF